MKLIAVIILGACLQVSAKGYSQKISLSVKDVPMAVVFEIISKQSGYRFFYNAEQVINRSKITLTVQDTDIHKVLATIFSNEPLTYEVVDKVIVIKEKKDKHEINGKEFFEYNELPKKRTGKVTNAQGEPLAGANIVNKRTGKGTTTNAKGEFTLELDDDDIIVISYIGYQTKQVNVGDGLTLHVQTDIATNPLDKVVIQGYGTTTQRLATGNIAKVTSEEISKQPVMNPLQALQGRVAGLIVTQTSGYGSAPFKIELRGRTNINPNFLSEPLYVIDGVPFTILELSGSNYASGSPGLIQNGMPNPASGQSPFFSINPSDIESIEVLKDADATAIYGSRGANGVILITTKRGHPGKSKLSINVYHGISKVTRYWDMLNTNEYINMRREAFKNDNIAPSVSNAYDILVWDTTRNTNWQKYLWGGTGKTTDAQFSLSGGDSRTKFRIATGYHHQTNILTISGADQRGAISFNLNHKTFDNKLTVSFTSSYSYSMSDMINLQGNVATLPPNAPAVYDDNGNLNYMGWAPAQNNFPFENLLQPYTSRTESSISSLQLGYQLIKGISFNTAIGYTSTQADQTHLQPIASKNPLNSIRTGTSLFGANSLKNLILEPTVEFNRFLLKGKLNIFVGASMQSTKSNGIYIYASGYIDDGLLKSPSNAASTNTTGAYGNYKYAAIFGRLNYNWANKYILNLTGRRDGSSRFGPGKQFGNFAGIGLAWVFTEEALFKKSMKAMTFGKLRGSFGTTGSDAVGDYRYLSRWSSNGMPTYQGNPSLAPLQHANPDYRWQINKKLELGLDFGLLQDRISLSIAYYQNRCGNQLVEFPLPGYTGFADVTANLKALVENSGFEFSLNAKLIKSKSVEWTLNTNAGINKNKLVSYPNLDQSPYHEIYAIGFPLNIKALLKYTGVDPGTGKYTFEDKNKNGSIDVLSVNEGDLHYFDMTPKFSGGLGSQLNYKSFQFNIFLNFVKQIGLNAFQTTNYPGYIANFPNQVLRRWKQTGEFAEFARFTTQGDETDQYFFSRSNGIYTDASFVRLQNIALSYRFSDKLINRFGLQNCNAYIQGQNIFVITHYKGVDPETQNFGGMPPNKIFAVGVQFNF